MAKYTEHLRLVKPEGNEYYNVEQFNQNSELIDKETKKLSEGLAKVQEGATKEKKGIVQFGTEEGKALEGMMLARLAGCVGYGGDIQTAGVKDINYIYYDRNTRKMYKCLNQNSDVSANVANFIPLDNNSLLDRLENLSKNTYMVLKNSSLRQALIETLNTNINLINMPEPNTIPELRDIIEENTRVEAFKIINNNYGIRWLIWGGENLYYAFMWNSSTNLKITKIG